jgi:hypothetical protein
MFGVRMGARWRYSLHDLINIESEFRLTQLSQFSVPNVPAVDLRIERDSGRMAGGVRIDQYDWNEETQTLVADFAPFVRASLSGDDESVVMTMTRLYARLSNFDTLAAVGKRLPALAPECARALRCRRHGR